MRRFAALLLVTACATPPPPAAPSPAPSPTPVTATPPAPAAPAPVALAPRVVPDGWAPFVSTEAGLALAFPEAPTTKEQRVSQGGRSARMQEWAYLGDGEAYSVRMVTLDPAPGAPTTVGTMASEAIAAATSMYGAQITEDKEFRAAGWTGRDVHLVVEGQYARLLVATSAAQPERMVSLFALVGRIQIVDRLGKFGDSLALQP